MIKFLLLINAIFSFFITGCFLLPGGNTVDTSAPVITLVGDASIVITVGDTFTDPGATAVDETDGDISGDIAFGGDIVDTGTVGTYTITYNVSDAAGNAAVEVTREVSVVASVDETPPVITLLGDAAIFRGQDLVFIDPGAIAEDDVDGDISADIAVGGEIVDTSMTGTYSITYNVTDAAGNSAAEVTRTVSVVAYRIAKFSTFDAFDLLQGYFSYEYNASGNITTRSSFDPVDVLERYVTHGYNPTTGKLTTRSFYDDADVLESYLTYEYAPDTGDLTKNSSFDSSDVLQFSTTFTYDTAGRMTRLSDFNNTDTPQGYTTLEYDANRNVTRWSQFSSTDALSSYTELEYNTDADIIMLDYFSASDVLVGYFTYEVDNSGFITKVSYFDADDTLSSYSTLEWVPGAFSYFLPVPLYPLLAIQQGAF